MNNDLIQLHTKQELLRKWEEEKLLFTSGAVEPPACLRCGKAMRGRLSENALSRALDVHICPECGMDEALLDFAGDALPVSQWYAVRNGLPSFSEDAGRATLTMECDFEEIFRGPKKRLPLSSLSYPVSLVAYSRSDYDEYKWWTTWFGRPEDRPSRALAQEIDAFQDALLGLPEFQTLRSMTRMCKLYAQRTSERSVYHLYSRTEHFNVLLRMITREWDYNLYVNYYLRNPVQNAE